MRNKQVYLFYSSHMINHSDNDAENEKYIT